MKNKRKTIAILILGILAIAAVVGVSGSATIISTTRPENYIGTPIQAKVVDGTVLLVKDVDPWEYASNEEVLTALGIPYDIARSSDIAGIDLSQYKVVIIGFGPNTRVL